MVQSFWDKINNLEADNNILEARVHELEYVRYNYSVLYATYISWHWLFYIEFIYEI